MTEIVPMAKALVTKLVRKTLRPLKDISPALDTVTMDDEGIQYTFSIDSVAPAPYKSQANDGIDKDSNIQSASTRRNEKKADRNNEA